MEGVNAEILVVCAKEGKNYNADQLIGLGKNVQVQLEQNSFLSAVS
jgi:hypothetical protein